MSEESFSVRGGPLRRVQVIVNPAAGKDQPILKTVNAALQTSGVEWDLSVTKDAGDAHRLAQEAAEAGADLVIVNGGDGTVMEAASGLVSTETSLAIIPGGTANVMAAELGIPTSLEESVTLALNPKAQVRPVDMGKIGEHWFLLRAGMGLEAAMVEGADREMKDRFGVLAYGLSALQAMSDPPIARYHLTIDGQAVESEGLTCFIANSGTMGRPGLNLAPGIDVSDGMLDVVVVTRADLPGLLALAASVVGGSENPNTLQRWQAREIYVEAEPPQTVQVDGELIGQTPITARVIPHAVRIIVPPAVAS